MARVLVATDGSEDASLTLRAAADLCCRRASELHLIHAWRPARPGWGRTRSAYSQREVEEYVGRRRREAERPLEEQAREAEDHGAHVAEAHLREGRPAEEIADLAEETGADLVMVGSRGLGTIERLLLGSVAEGVVRLAIQPTLVVRGGEESWSSGRIVAGDDSSEEAREAASFAAGIGGVLGARLLLIRAYPPEILYEAGEGPGGVGFPEGLRKKGEEEMEGRADDLEPLLGTRPEVEIATGDPAAVIQKAVDESPEPTLTVVGRRGLGGISRFPFGDVSTDVLRAVDGPVLVVSAPRPQQNGESHV